MLEKIRKWLDQLKYKFSRQSCYDDMVARGEAALGMCGGVMGGDASTDYLNYDCIDCPYFVGFEL